MIHTILRITLIYLLLEVCPGQTTGTLPTSQSTNYAAKECDHKLLRIDSLAKFNRFMYHLIRSQLARPKRGFLNRDKGLTRCFDIADQLIELRRIVAQRHKGVCRVEFTELLVQFYLKYLADDRAQMDPSHAGQPRKNFQSRTTYGGHIFSLIAHQVAYTCKSKMNARLKQAQQDHNCLQVVVPFLPAAILESSEPQEESSYALSFLKNFKRVEDLAFIRPKPASGTSEPYFQVLLSSEALARVEALKQLCREREPYFMGIFAPIVSLSEIGYEVPDALIEARLEANDEEFEPNLLKCWLVTAQLCQGILRTNITGAVADADNGHDNGDKKKLVEIKFGHIPDGAPPPDESAAVHQAGPIDSFEELSPNVVELVKRRALFTGRMKGALAAWAKRFVAKQLNIDAMRDEGARQFMELLTRDENSTDLGVSFCGKKRNQGIFKASRLVTDDSDTIVQSTSFVLHKAIAIMLSSVVAICLSAVFLWFTLYALVTSLKGHNLPEANGNFKETWRQMRDQRMATTKDKVKLGGWADKMVVYRSPTG